MSIAGETIDFGPCAFLDTFDPAAVYSSIDAQGRYAYGNQPRMAQWNLARLAESLLPLLHADHTQAIALATQCLATFTPQYHNAYMAVMRRRLGLGDVQPDDVALVEDLLALLQQQRRDYATRKKQMAEGFRNRIGYFFS